MDSKVTDYNAELVRDKLVNAFKMRKREATPADLVAVTGLPKPQVDAELPAVADEYGARLRVTESGEILYSFPDGMKSRYHGFGPGFRRFWKSFKRIAAKVSKAAFKVWIMVTLIGYFLLFVALTLLALCASVVVSVGGSNSNDSRSSDRHGGGIGGLWLASNLVDTFVRIWFYSELFKSPEERYYENEARFERRQERKKRPIYTAIFSFVFGDGDPNAGWDEVEKRAVVAFLQSNKGIMTLYEFMAITGLRPVDAEKKINSYLVEFEGEPEVSDDGAIYYRFKNIMRRSDKTDRTFGGTVPVRRPEVFSANPAKMNHWFIGLNAVNLLFGSYFLYGSLTVTTVGAAGVKSGFDAFYAFTYVLFQYLGLAAPGPFLGLALGAFPLVFSVFFFGIPFIRSRQLKAKNEDTKLENMRRIAYRAAVQNPAGISKSEVQSLAEANDASKPEKEGAADGILLELAGAAEGEASPEGAYRFSLIQRTEAAAARERLAIKDSDFDLGGTVFDSRS